ncbi:MAG: helix-turn-helix transcriptional regulator [Candidatus Gastranaerophilales bacterium]|nr:helix-turn-helix transcriptional regulator [Candidatus Gastranaerophilales bacterium]
MDIKKALGKKIQAIRKQKKLTQEKLAELIDIEIPSLSNIERGKFSPAVDTLQKIAKALDVEISDLYKFSKVNHEDMVNEICSKLPQNKKLTELTYKFFKTIEYDIL